jgi:hypothetical protein
MMEILIMPVREIANARLHGTRFDKLRHQLPRVLGLSLGGILCFSRFFKECDDHRLPFSPANVPDRPRLALLKYTFHC